MNKKRVHSLTPDTSLMSAMKIIDNDTLCNTFNGILHRFSRNNLKLKPNKPLLNDHPKKITKNDFNIFLKSPYVVAGGELCGTLLLHPHKESITVIKSLILSFKGVETIQSNTYYSTTAHQHEFLHIQEIQMNSSEIEASFQNNNDIALKFVIPLPSNLGSSYRDKKCSVQYYLQSDIECVGQENEGYTISKKRIVPVYCNSVIKSMKHDANNYAPIIISRQLWPCSLDKDRVRIDLTLSRSIWVAGSPIYVNIKMTNNTDYKITDIKMQLIREQNNYIHSEDKLVPISSTSNVIQKVSLAKMDWWTPLKRWEKDQLVLNLQPPSHQASVYSQKLIKVEFFIRVILCSHQKRDVLCELPILLVDPISLDPPPGRYCNSIVSDANYSRIFLRKNFKKECQAAQFLEIDSDSFSTTDIDTYSYRLPHSLSGMSEDTSDYSVYSGNESRENGVVCKTNSVGISSSTSYVQKLRRSISAWSQQFSNKRLDSLTDLRINKRNNSEHQFCPQLSQSLDDINPDRYQAGMLVNGISENSLMRVGHMEGPKKLNSNPGSLGDAGLDIRKHFNVATATEALEGYAATQTRKHIPSTLSQSIGVEPYQIKHKAVLTDTFPLSHSQLSVLKGFKAPSDKLEINRSTINYISETSPGENSALIINKSNNNGNLKKILDTSRYILNTQWKNMSFLSDR
ncbi:hypothetical protein BDB01DRAFT_896076 [Pilobolus umbonatus]|nr:hypothetical protein BDB01DRAFT_896076 [Pilobolus umbonatus]